jgi:TolA-binding protein
MQKTEIPGIYKQSRGILVNKDNDSLEKYRRKRDLQKQKELQINTLEDQVNMLTRDIEEIKLLLKVLVENK